MGSKAQIEIELSSGAKAGQTIKELSQSANRLNKEINNLKPGSEEFIKKTKDYQKVTGRLKDVRTEVKGVDKAQKGMNASFLEFLPFGSKIQGFGANMSQLKGQIGGATQGSKLFKKALWGIGIGLIIAAISTLVGWLQKTQVGMDLVSGVMEGLSVVIDEVIGRLFKFGKGLLEFFKGNFRAGIDQMSSSFDNLGGSIKEAFNEGRDIVKARKELERFIRQQEVAIAKSQAYADQQRAIADDATRSFKEREAAAEAARKSSEAAARAEIDLNNRRFAQLQREHASKKKSGLFTDEMAEKEKEANLARIAAENELYLITLENEKQRGDLKQDRLERDLDILIDGFDNIKTINEKIIESDKLTIDEKRKKFAELKALSDGSFAEQIKTIEQFTDKQFDANDLLATQDAKLLNEKIRNLELSEIIEGRLLEIVRDRRTALSDFAEVEQGINDTELARKEERAEKEEKTRKENFDDEVASLELLNETRVILANQAFVNEQITAEERAAFLIQLELERLQKQEQLIKDYYGAESLEAQKAANKIKKVKQDEANFVNRLEDGKKKKAMQAASGTLSFLTDIAAGIGDLNAKDEEKQRKARIAQATAAAIQASLNAYKSTADIPFVGSVLAPIAAAAALVFGLKKVDQIKNVKKAEYGTILRGNRHSQGGIMVNAEDGEIILNRNVSRDPAGLAMASELNARYGGIRFMESGGPVNPLSAQSVAATASGVTGGATLQASDDMVNEFRSFRAEINEWQSNLQVHNNVQDTQKGIKVINDLEDDAGF